MYMYLADVSLHVHVFIVTQQVCTKLHVRTHMYMQSVTCILSHGHAHQLIMNLSTGLL